MGGSPPINHCKYTDAAHFDSKLIFWGRDEHHKRSPDCTFFSLISDHKQKSPPKKAARGRKPRASKASRLSTQSTITTTSEAPSFADTAADEGDSVLTAATNTTVTSKAGKGKKTAAKGRKVKAKKEEAVEEIPAPEPEDDDFTVKVEQPKATRGRKRASEAMDDSALLVTQAPPAKRRATRTRGSMALEETSLAPSVVVDDDIPMSVAADSVVTSKKTRKGRGSTAKSMRNVSSASTASKASLRMNALDDDEIDRMLEADLERPLTDEEDNSKPSAPSIASKSAKQASVAPVGRAARGSRINNEGHAMFGAEPMEIDEAAIDAELEAMEVEESKPLPKAKGAKGKQARKPSAKQQAAAQKAAAAEAQREAELKEQVLEQSVQMAPARGTRVSELSANGSVMSTTNLEDSGNETDASMASQSTVVRGGNSRRGSTLKKGKGGKRVVSRNIEEIVHKSVEAAIEEVPTKKAGRPKKAVQMEDAKPEEVQYPDMSMSQEPSISEPTSKAKLVAKAKGKGQSLPRSSVDNQLESALASTPKRSTKELTPTPSPQSSDAENHPPSSKPSTIKPPTHQTSRVPLAISTPTQAMSPSKRNILAGLQTSNPWTPVNLDEIFTSTPGVQKENYDILREASDKVRGGKLTSPEKKMTVEQWILFNASLAEEKLRRECEGMVGSFEEHGGRAMRVLQGIECEE